MAPLPKPDDFALDMEALRPRVYSRDWNTLVRRQSVSDLKVCILIEIKTRYPSTSRLNDKVEITCQFVKIYWSTPHPEDTFNTRRYRGGSHALSGSRAGIGTEATWWIIWGKCEYPYIFPLCMLILCLSLVFAFSTTRPEAYPTNARNNAYARGPTTIYASLG